MNMENSLLRLEGIKKYYANGRSVAMGLGGVSMSFSRGEFVAVTGESGSGKSTLARVIGGIIKYESGEMFCNGIRTSHLDAAGWENYRRKNISFISQNYDVLPGASVISNVISALRLSGMEKSEAKTAAEDILRKVELWDERRRRAARLSSGQKQRLSIARALAKPAPILIADEPTGNLDAENSAKVIRLLSEMAHDRLVIIVTHDYAEVEDHVTRRITLNDGLVVSDTLMRPANKPGTINVPSGKKRKKGIDLYIAGLQMKSRPVWSAIAAVVFSLSAFAVFAFLGVFIINIDDAFTYTYDSKAFANGDDKRIVVSTSDGIPLTQDDYDKLISVSHVSSIERFDYVSDVRYAYRENIDHRVDHKKTEELEKFPFEKFKFTKSVSVGDSAPFMRTIPILPEGTKFISEGREPVGFDEVVAAKGSAKLGDTLNIIIYDRKNWGSQTFITFEMEVVGLTDIGEGLYFSYDVGIFLKNSANKDIMYDYIYDDDVQEGTFLCSPTTASKYRRALEDIGSAKFGFPSFENEAAVDDEQGRVTLTWAGDDGFNCGQHGFRTFSNLYIVSAEDYPKLISKSALEDKQASVYIEDYAYADRVLDELHALGYAAASPYRIGSTKQDEKLADERTQTLRICCTALAAVIVMQVLLLTALFTAERDSYRILSDLGLSSGSAKRSILCQLLFFTVIGQLLGGVAVFICGASGVERIENMLKYLPPSYIIILSAVHLAASLIAGIFILRGIEKHVYPMAAKNRDILIDEETEA